MSHFENLFLNGAVLVADEFSCAVFLCGCDAVGSCADCDYPGSAAKISACNGHKAYRADTDYKHLVAELNIGQFHAVKSSGNHVGQHAGVHNVYGFRQKREVSVCVVHMKVFRENAVLEI